MSGSLSGFEVGAEDVGIVLVVTWDDAGLTGCLIGNRKAGQVCPETAPTESGSPYVPTA